MNNSNPTLRKAYKLLKKITKKMGRSDLYFSAQLGIDSSKDERVVTYAAMIEAPADQLEPVYFAALTKEEFIEKLENFLNEKATVNELKKAFHLAQVESNKRSIEHHENEIKAIEEIVDKKITDDFEQVEEDQEEKTD